MGAVGGADWDGEGMGGGGGCFPGVSWDRGVALRSGVPSGEGGRTPPPLDPQTLTRPRPPSPSFSLFSLFQP